MINDEQKTHFRSQGFVHIPSVITREEAAHFYEAALDYTRRNPQVSTS